MKYDTAAPYIASFIVLKIDGKVAFVLRSNTSWMNGYYGLPSGKVEKGEYYLAAAAREAKEEIGITITEANLRHVLTVHRQEQPDDGANNWVDVYFAVDSFEGEPYNAEPDVHSELAWLDPNNLPSNVIPSVKHALKSIEAGKTYVEYNA